MLPCCGSFLKTTQNIYFVCITWLDDTGFYFVAVLGFKLICLNCIFNHIINFYIIYLS